MRSPRIEPECTKIPAGWPRPHYLDRISGKPRYAQWIGQVAFQQIHACNDARSILAGRSFACSSCAGLLTRGLLLDPTCQILPRGRAPHHNDVYDAQVSSPLCHRCVLFAIAQCPQFTALDAAYGSDLLWVEVLAPGDYEEYDESGVLLLTAAGQTRPRVPTEVIRKRVANGELFLTGESAADLPEAIGI